MSKATFDPTRYNTSDAPDFQDVLQKTLARRQFLKNGSGLAALSIMAGMGLAGCGSSSNKGGASVSTTPPTLGFEAIDVSKTDGIAIPANYKAQVLAPWGTPLNDNAAEWKADGTNTPTDQLNAVGMHHDGMHFFPLNSETDGLLCINHEYVDQKALHPNGVTQTREEVSPDKFRIIERPEMDEVLKEIYAHGVTVVRIKKTNGVWEVVKNDPHNKRYTGATEIDLAGPMAGTDYTKTKYSPNGMSARGTLNNCGNGYTPWGTYLTCEENWPDYFVNRGTLTKDQLRIGVNNDLEGSRYGWDLLGGAEGERDDEFARFNVTALADSPLMDYRNEANGHGYIVEIDPYNPAANAVKRTALGRFRHEGCVFGKLEAGKPIVFYSGHDAQFEYIYKFESKELWNPADANREDRYAVGSKYMDEGTLYVARFDEMGAGVWLPLTLNTAKPDSGTLADDFDSLAAIIHNTAEAGKLLKATPMDRPEWGAVDPITGTVYFTLTNNTDRVGDKPDNGVNLANPRLNNTFGHIIRWDEAEGNTFTWDIFLFGAPAAADIGKDDDDPKVNLSFLTDSNQLASPDGLGFDSRGILWVQTDNGNNDVGKLTNDQVLAVVPSLIPDQAADEPTINAQTQSDLRRFLVGPNGCEITGLAYADNHKSFFANVQHPGNWPYSANAAEVTPEGMKVRPRAATVVVEHMDGMPVGEA